jgi:hypothetical protein
MEMPEELALKRDAYFSRKTDLQSGQTASTLADSVKRTENELGDVVNMKDL